MAGRDTTTNNTGKNSRIAAPKFGSMKQIVIFTDCYFPVVKSVSFLIRDLSQELQSEGMKVILVAADNTINEQFAVVRENNLTLIRVRSFDTKKTSFLLRGLGEFALPFFMHSVIKKMKTDIKPDLILVYSPSIFLAIAAHRLKNTSGAPVYLILRDIFPDWAIEAKVVNSKPVQFILRLFARYQFKISNRIGLQSKRDLKLFKSGHYSANAKKSELLPNWRASWEPPTLDESIRKKLGLDDKVIFLIGGSIGPAQDPELILKIAQKLGPNHRAHFLFIGSGPLFSAVENRVKNENISNITMLSAMPFNEYAKYLMSADVGTLLLNGSLTSDNIPGRFLDYLQASLPVLALINDENELFAYIMYEQIGAVASSSDFTASLNAVNQLTNTTQVRYTLGKKGPSLLNRDFSPESAAKKVLRLLDNKEGGILV